jgi:F0F1-type ATP synthase epsilon subunit
VTQESFVFKVLTPGGVVREQHVSSAILPACDGQIGVLPLHIDYTGLLGTGVVEYFPVETDQPEKVAIGGGLCTFSDECLVVLADFVETPEGVNKETYAAERESLSKTLREGSGFDPAWETARRKLDRIEAVDEMLK